MTSKWGGCGPGANPPRGPASRGTRGGAPSGGAPAEGRGLGWAAGERVEGFSNPAWVLVMAAVHAAGTPESTAALAVKAIAWMIACAVLVLSIRLRRQLAGSHVWADAALLLMLAMNADVVF